MASNENMRGFKKFLHVLGNGNPFIGLRNLTSICDRVEYARKMHTWKGRDERYGFNAISDEVIELDLEEGKNRQRCVDECLDVIATSVRYLNAEWEK